MDEFILPVRVYIDDTDAGGVVYHAQYLKFLEHARTESLRAHGIKQPAIANDGKILVVASVNIQYLGAARLDDKLDATAIPSKLANTYVVFDQTVRRGGDILCKACVKVASVEKSTLKITLLPPDTHNALKLWMTS